MTFHEVSEEEERYSSTLFLTSALDSRGWSTPSPGRLTAVNDTRYPLHRELGSPRAGLDGCGKSRPPLGFDRRTVHPAVSRYTTKLSRPTLTGCRPTNHVKDFTSFTFTRVYLQRIPNSCQYVLHSDVNLSRHFIFCWKRSENKARKIVATFQTLAKGIQMMVVTWVSVSCSIYGLFRRLEATTAPIYEWCKLFNEVTFICKRKTPANDQKMKLN